MLRHSLLSTLLILGFGSTALAQDLAGTRWHGSENLQNFGKLSFLFHPGNRVVMVDSQGESPGIYRQDGPKVILVFGEGRVVYMGQLQGNRLAGKARNPVGTVWDWQTTRETPPAPQPEFPDFAGDFDFPKESPAPKQDLRRPEPVTATNLPEYLRSLGYAPKTGGGDKGPAFCVLHLEKDGWKYTVEVRVGQKGGMWLIAPLADVRSTEADKLFKVLQANHRLAPSFFSLRSGRLCLNLEVLGLRPAGDSFRRDVDRMCRAIRETNGLWAPAPAAGAVEEEATPPLTPAAAPALPADDRSDPNPAR